MFQISPSEVRALVEYDPETGILYWLPRGSEMFKQSGCGGADGNAQRWNARYLGKKVGNINQTTGYIEVRIHRRKYGVHRIAWACHHGVWPEEIDHVNGVRTDNRLANLRAVSHSQNSKNRALPKNNASGRIGVRWHKAARKWVAEIRLGGEQRHLGLFESLEEASEARMAAEVRLGFHPNHGRNPSVNYRNNEILPGISAGKVSGRGRQSPQQSGQDTGADILPDVTPWASDRNEPVDTCRRNRAGYSAPAEFPPIMKGAI